MDLLERVNPIISITERHCRNGKDVYKSLNGHTKVKYSYIYSNIFTILAIKQVQQKDICFEIDGGVFIVHPYIGFLFKCCR